MQSSPSSSDSLGAILNKVFPVDLDIESLCSKSPIKTHLKVGSDIVPASQLQMYTTMVDTYVAMIQKKFPQLFDCSKLVGSSSKVVDMKKKEEKKAALEKALGVSGSQSKAAQPDSEKVAEVIKALQKETFIISTTMKESNDVFFHCDLDFKFKLNEM